MKIKLIIFFVISIMAIGNVPDRINENIDMNSLIQDNKRLYIRNQERAYKRIVSLGEKEGLSKEKIDNEVARLEKKYGTDYEIIYKHFYYDVKEVSKKDKKNEEIKKINNEKKIEYKKIMKESKLPENIKVYIDNQAQNKYPNDYFQRVKYTEELIEFYNFIKK